MPLNPGTRLGSYEIIAPLGAGGMGEVYLARDQRLGRNVAIKVLARALADDPDRLARFEREARTVASLNHPNIVTLYTFEDVDGHPILVMELVEGRTLIEAIPPGGMPVADLLDIAMPVADALAAAHAKGIVHRDLKPGNVMLTADRRVKVLDFGLARLLAGDEPANASASMAPTRTEVGVIMGTVLYMSPEQLRGDPVDARADLFSLGILIYELATGERPFLGASLPDIASAILRDPVKSVSALRPDLPRDLDRIIGRCLEKAAADRFQTARDVYNELRLLKRESEGGARSTPAAEPVVEETPSIAVLPFLNLSRDVDNEYFADGLAEELLNVLSKIKRLRVAARTSSFLFKGKEADIETIGRQLRVRTVLEGSVRRAGKRVRISAQLVQVSDGFHLWSETYDRELDDIFEVQDDIARAVVKELRATLLGERADTDAAERARAEVKSAAAGRGTNVNAYHEVLLARHFEKHLGPENLRRAADHYRKAVRLDPDYALAWASLARVQVTMTGYGWLEPLAEGHRLAREAADRALALDPDLPEANEALGAIHLFLEWDWAGAEEAYHRALTKGAGGPLLNDSIAWFLINMGRHEQALRLLRALLEQDPLNGRAYRFLTHAHWRMGNLGEAEAACRRSIDILPESPIQRCTLGRILLDAGRPEEALAECQRETDKMFRAMGEAIAFHWLGRQAESDAALAILETAADGMAVQLAMACASRDEPDAVFKWLEHARISRDTGIAAVVGMPVMRKLHGDPRWGQFLDSIGWPRDGGRSPETGGSTA